MFKIKCMRGSFKPSCKKVFGGSARVDIKLKVVETPANKNLYESIMIY